MLIRPARPVDAVALADLQLRCWLQTYGRLVPAGALESDAAEQRLERWRDTLAGDTQLLVLERAGGLSGFAGSGAARDDDLAERSGELYGLYLLAASQGLGFGRALHDRAIVDLTSAGAAEAVLWTLSANEPARGFYVAAGWRLDGRVAPQATRWGLSKVRYRRELP